MKGTSNRMGKGRDILKSLLALALGAALSVSAFAQDTPEANTRQANTKWYKGSYDYGYVDNDTVRGHEDFTVTVHPDGSRTVETFVDLRELGHQSNVIMRVDKRFRPLDSYAQFWRFGEYGGAARVWLEANDNADDTLHGNIVGPKGHVTQAIPVPDLFSLRLHPVIIEGWQVWHFDKSKPGPQTQPLFNVVTTTTTGVRGVGTFQDNTVDFKGTETVETPAGTFEADHYTFYNGRYDIWLHGEDQILVRYIAPGNGREYRLTRFEVGP